MAPRARATAYPRKRHRVAVSVTFSHKVSEANARIALQRLLEGVAHEGPVLLTADEDGGYDIYVEALKAVRS